MALFPQEIFRLTNSALNELNSLKTAHNPLSEAHYLAAWVTKAIKSKRFDRIALQTLKAWQSQARSLGKNAHLKAQFNTLQKCYSRVLDAENQLKPVSILMIEKLYGELSARQWQVTTQSEIAGKLKIDSGGRGSLLLCAEQLKSCFDKQGQLINTLSLYIRGDRQAITDLAFEHNLLLYKKTDYKSKVKYHGELLIFPDNNGTFLPEFPGV